MKGQTRHTDWFVHKYYVPKWFFTPPFEIEESLKEKLEAMYAKVKVDSVGAMDLFYMQKSIIFFF